MNVEIIAVGTELLMGETINTNANYLNLMCRDLGLNVYYNTTVGDNPQRLLSALDVAFKRGADCVITTGGLGPTTDDLTKELSAQYLGLDLVYNEEEAKLVEAKVRFLDNNRAITSNNLKQAYFPEGATILPNAVGTAAGCAIKKDNKLIINLPGPPKELIYMTDNVVKDYLRIYKKDTLYTYEFITTGIGESRLATLLGDIIAVQKDTTIAIYAQEDFVRVRLAVKAADQKRADILLAPLVKAIKGKISPYLVPKEGLREALLKIMPPYTINYHSDLRLSSDFNLGARGTVLIIDIDSKPEPLGEIVTVMLTYQGKQVCFRVPLLYQAQLSIKKLEAKIVMNIYQTIKGDSK